MSVMNVGIVGFGRIGAEHARWLAAGAGLAPVAVVDATPARQGIARARGLKAYDELAPLLRDETIHGVLISTPTAMHFDHAAAALSAGKHVMIEKPMAMDLPQSRQLVERAQSAGRILSVFHNRRWDIDYLTVKAAVASGAFGEVINVESRLGQWSSCVGPAAKEYRPGWRNEASFGGGGLYDWGSHFIDQLWRLLFPARPIRVFAQLRGNVWTKDCDDFARVLIDFDSGAVGMVEINTTTTRPQSRWHIDGTSGSASSPHSPDFDTRVWAELRFSAAGREEAPPFTKPDTGLSETQIWEQFAAAARSEGEPAVRMESVLPTMALLDVARESSRRGAAVVLPADLDWQE